jgi:FAD/FMN-containing dehydrogenase
MNRLRELDALNDTITVEAGCVLAAVQRAADEAGRFFPLSLAAEGSCQIGGNLSTNAGGVNVLRYGMAREQVLGLEVVLPDGQVWDGLRSLRKDNTGYDLKQLFLGAEGTLGIITAAVLRLHPKPTASATAWIALDSPRRAVELLSDLRERLGERLSAFELVSRSCLEAVLAHSKDLRDPLADPRASLADLHNPLAAVHPWYVLAELTDSGETGPLRERVERALADCAERGALRDAVLAQSLTQARTLWRIRESIPEAQFTNVKHDVSVPVSRTPELIERVQTALEAAFPAAQPYVFGHVGDGNLHYNIGPASLLERRAEVNRLVFDAVSSLGGSISAEHGLGQLKRDEILRHKSLVEVELMRTLKRALDPKGLMNPGKVL